MSTTCQSANASLRFLTARTAILLVPLLLILLGGCRSAASLHVDGAYQPQPPGGVDFGKFNDTARPRLGGLPYPGAFTLFELADLNKLGRHSYTGGLGSSETERGIIYTCRGGFIDLAHTRKSIDLSKHVAVRAKLALMNDWSAFRVKSLEPSLYIVRLQYPAFWKTLPPAEKEALAEELSIRIGQRIAMLMVTWHETLTWFGYQSTPLITERQSAFTWDDTGAHAFGVFVAGRAMHARTRDWDQAVTDALAAALRELEPVTPDQALLATRKIEGRWWSGFEPLKRQIQFGWNGNPVVAWLVPGLPFCKNPVPHRYELPRLDDVLGRDFSTLLRVEIQPNVWEGDRISRTIPGHPATIDVDKDLPFVLQHMRQWHIQHGGEQVLRPD